MKVNVIPSVKMNYQRMKECGKYLELTYVSEEEEEISIIFIALVCRRDLVQQEVSREAYNISNEGCMEAPYIVGGLLEMVRSIKIFDIYKKL